MARRQSAIITLDQQRYFIQRTKVTLNPRLNKKLREFPDDFIPVTAIVWDKAEFNDVDLKAICSEYEATDDVWNSSFLSVIVLLQPKKLDGQANNKQYLRLNNSEAKLPRGPLVIEKSTGRIFKVSRLFRDTHYAFISAIEPDPRLKLGFFELPDKDELEIPVPSRLYFEPSETQPLAGVRLAIKDTIALKGLRTGYGNKAWADTHLPEKFTAPCVRQLLDAGAIVVGKTKSSEFAEGVDPAEWSEGICPYNPRGDGHQKPSSSSTGSASATAAYEWLDVAYGTDTGGSIRHPAGVQGLFGQRPTQGKIDLTGVLGATPLFNTVGIFARDAKMFTKVGGILADPTYKQADRPERRKYNLLYPTRVLHQDSLDPHHGNQQRWFPHPETDPASYTDVEKQFESFVSRLETELDCTRVPFNVDQLWRATHPIDQPRSIDEATGYIYGVITTASAWQTDIDKFIQKYAAENEGMNPRISKLVHDRFLYGSTCSEEKITAAVNGMDAFRRWVLNDLFGSLDQDATTLLIFPQSWGRPDYREQGRDSNTLFKEAFSIYSFAYLCGCPDYTIPVGEIPYHSSITDEIEYLPTSISLVGRPGTDLDLFNVVDRLYDEGIVSDVMAGRRMYEVV